MGSWFLEPVGGYQPFRPLEESFFVHPEGQYELSCLVKERQIVPRTWTVWVGISLSSFRGQDS